MKRTLLTTGLIAAFLLAADFSASAVSNETLPDSAAQVVEGTTQTPENQDAGIDIDVCMPDKAEFILNPYRLTVNTPGGATREQVFSVPQTITSHTAAPLSVTVRATGAAHGEASVAASPDELNNGAKAAFFWLEFHNVTDGEEPVWSGAYTGTRNQVLLNEEGRPVLELPACEDGEAVKAVFRIFGAAGLPSAGMWTAEDIIDVSLSFDFEVIEDEDVTLCGVILPDVEEPVDVADEASDVDEAADVVDEASNVEEAVDAVDEASDVDEAADVVDDASGVDEAVDVAEASDVEEAVDVAEASDVEEAVDVADDEASDVEEPVDVAADEASDVEEAVDDVDDVAYLVKPMITSPPQPMDTDEASEAMEPTIGAPPIPMDVDEEGVDDADEAADVDEVDDVADVDEVDDVADVDEVDEAADVDEGVDDEGVDVDEASDVDEGVDAVDEASEAAKRPEEEEPVEEEQVPEDA